MIGGRKNFLFDLRSPIQSEFRYDEEVPFREKEEKVEPSVRESKVRERNNVTVGGDEGSRLDQRLFSTVTTHRQPLRAVFVDQSRTEHGLTRLTTTTARLCVCLSLSTLFLRPFPMSFSRPASALLLLLSLLSQSFTLAFATKLDTMTIKQ